MDDPTVMLAASKDRPAGWNRPVQLDMDVAFDAISEPHYAVGGAQGHFEQTGRVSGTIRVGDERWDVDGLRRARQVVGTANVAGAERQGRQGRRPGRGRAGLLPELVLDELRRRPRPRRRVRPDGRRHVPRQGLDPARRRDARPRRGHDDHRRTTRPTRCCTSRCSCARPTAPARSIVVDGTVLSICPTKIPRRDGVTFVNEGLARFETDGRVGFGISEHWHAVPR